MKLRFAAVVFALAHSMIFGPCPRTQAAEGKMDRDLALGRKYLKQKQYGPAIGFLTAAIKAHPQDFEGYLARAAAYNDLLQFAKAIADLDTVIELNPGCADAYYRRAWIHDEFCHHQLKVRDLRKAIELASDPGYMLSDLAWTYDELGEYQKEFEAWTRLTRLAPGYAYGGHAGRALAHIRLGRFNEAIADCNAALNVSKTDRWMHHLKGYCFHRLKKYPLALDEFNACLKIAPSYGQDQLNRGLIHYEMGNYKRAIDDYTSVLAFKDYRDFVYANRALAYWKLGDIESARRDYARLLCLDNGQKVKQPVNVKTLVEEYKPLPILSAGRLHDPAYGIPFVQLLPGEEKRSLLDYDNIIKMAPHESDIYYHRGVARLCLGRSQEAASDLSNYLSKTSWVGSGPITAACFLYVARIKAGEKDLARQELLNAASRIKSDLWPRPVISYFLRKETARSLLRNRRLPNQTAARYFIGVDLIYQGYVKDGLSELYWVARHGDRDVEEHFLALAEIERLTKKK